MHRNLLLTTTPLYLDNLLKVPQDGLDAHASMQELKQKNSCCPNMTPFILMIALSVHSIFEGLALGLA